MLHRARRGLPYLADGAVTSSSQVSYFDCQLWGVQAEAGGLAGEDLSKRPSSNALLVLVHAAVKQKPDRQNKNGVSAGPQGHP